MGWMRMRIGGDKVQNGGGAGGDKVENGGGAGAGNREGGDVRSC